TGPPPQSPTTNFNRSSLQSPQGVQHDPFRPPTRTPWSNARTRLAHHVKTPKRKDSSTMSTKTTKFEKAAARMRKIQEEKLRAAEKEREQKAEMERLCGEAFIDAATGGK